MTEELYRLKETMRLIGKRLDRQMPVPDPSERISEMLRLLSDIPTPAEAEKRKPSKPH